MPPVRIARKAKGLLRKAARSEIESYFEKLTSSAKKNKWLRRGNRYRVSCVKFYEGDVYHHTVNDSDVVEYVAASGPTHVIDAWSLLSRAVEAALRGDNYGAIHFAYYAELRAAVALLACEGIGIFNRLHPIVKSNGQTESGIEIEAWDQKKEKIQTSSLGNASGCLASTQILGVIGNGGGSP